MQFNQSNFGDKPEKHFIRLATDVIFGGKDKEEGWWIA